MNADGKNAARRCRRAVAFAAALVLTGGVVLAQVSDAFDASWSLLPPGGGESASEDYHLVTTLGQTSAMESQSEGYRMQAGFLAGFQTILAPGEPPEPDDTSDLWLIH